MMFQPPLCNTVADGSFVLQGCHQILAQYYSYPDSQRVILFSHGNAEDLHTVGPFAKEMSAKLKISVIAYDYCGYGYSPEKPCSSCCNQSAEAVLRWLLLFFPSDKIILYGRSLGGGPSCYLARRYKVGGLILQSCFTSIRDMAKALLSKKHLGWLTPVAGLFVDLEQFDNEQLVTDLAIPALVIHGTYDQIVPLDQGKKLAALLKAATWFPPTGHNDVDLHWDYWAVLTKWLFDGC